MKREFCALALFGLCGLAGSAVFAADAAQKDDRKITIVQDNANIRFVSKVFQLKHVNASDLKPYINSAVRRYNHNSTVKRIFYPKANKEGLLVTTGVDFMPYVDDMIAKMDVNANGLAGTGIVRVAYNPRFRAALQFKDIIDLYLVSAQGTSGIDPATNTIFWRDDKTSAAGVLEWVKKLDRPLPQARVRFNYYEVRESTLRDVGIDYLAWKNGPGVNLFQVGYNAGRLAVEEAAAQMLSSATSWGYGGLFFAPAFDMSFVRCLQQSGHASVTANASLTMVNTPIKDLESFRKLVAKQKAEPETAPFRYSVSMYPEYQNIAKNGLGRSFVGASYETDETGTLHKNPPVLDLSIINPVVCFPSDPKTTDAKGFISRKPVVNTKESGNGGVIFRYSMKFKNVVERGNTGQELTNCASVTGGVTLGFNTEKIISVYEKDSDVKQTIGLPVLSKIPVLKYLFSTTTTVKERTYIIVTAEAELVHPSDSGYKTVSRSEGIHERKQNDFWED